MLDRDLNRGLGKSRLGRDRLQTYGYRVSFQFRGLADEVKVHDEGSGLTIVADQVRHQDIYDVTIQGEALHIDYYYTDYRYRGSIAGPYNVRNAQRGLR